MMIPFMGIQSAVMAEQFGTLFQYGKRRISAMSNEEFNKLTPQILQQNLTKQLQGMIPEMQNQIKAMQPMVKMIIEEFATYIKLATEALPKAIETATSSGLTGTGITSPSALSIAKIVTQGLIDFFKDNNILNTTSTSAPPDVWAQLIKTMSGLAVLTPPVFGSDLHPELPHVTSVPTTIKDPTPTTDPTHYKINVSESLALGDQKGNIELSGVSYTYTGAIEAILRLDRKHQLSGQNIAGFTKILAKGAIGSTEYNKAATDRAKEININTELGKELSEWRIKFKAQYGHWT